MSGELDPAVRRRWRWFLVAILALATIGTLVIVPAAYSLIARGKREEKRRAAASGDA